MIKKHLTLVLSILCANSSFAQNKIGIIVPLTGPLSEYGVAIKNGIELAQADSPLKFKKCKFNFEDSQYDPKTAISAYRKLTSEDNAAIVYNFGGPTSAAIAPLTNQAKIPTFLWTTDPSASTKSPYAIRFTNNESEYATALVNELNSRGIKKIAIVLTENQYLNSILAGVTKSLLPEQKLNIIDSLQPTDRDFRATIIKLKRESYDAVGVFLLSEQIGLFYKQMREQKVLLKSFGTDFFESSSEIKLANGGMEGSIYANNTTSEAFTKKYIQQFKNDSQITYAGNGYDFANLACSLLNDQVSETLMSRLTESKTHNGVLGDFKFIKTNSGDKYFQFPIVIKQIMPLRNLNGFRFAQ